MAVVYPTEDAGLEQSPEGGGGFHPLVMISEHPIWAIVVGLVLAVIIGYIINQLRTGGTSTPSSTTGQAGTTPTVEYVPTSNEFLNETSISGSYNTTNTTNNGEPPAPPSPHQPPVTQTMTAVIRSATSSGPFAAWDKTNKGVPVRKTAGGTGMSDILSIVPFGQTVHLTGGPVSGTNNDNYGGSYESNKWYPVQGGGYVNQVDLTNITGMTYTASS